ncbi:MAG TPA: holin family protein [Paracoccaceae bacterium]|nr:holin family protein [Paracoccaceae bacterium]
MIGRILGLGSAARGVGEAIGGVAEVFIGNRAEREAGEQERFNRVVAQFGEEFTRPVCGRFDGFVNGLNRLPRPMMALGTLVLFVYAMVDPPGFSTRMQGLGHVPEPLWWLLGAVVSFYFGARELHHYRGRRYELPPAPVRVPAGLPLQPVEAHRERGESAATPAPPRAQPTAAAASASEITDPDHNAAFEEWRRRV